MKFVPAAQGFSLGLEGRSMSQTTPTNDDIANILERVGDLLETKGNNPFRVRSYRNAAQAVREHETPVANLVDGDRAAQLKEIPGIGTGLAAAIEEIVDAGRLGLLDRLESEVSPEKVLRRVPGIGRKLAERIHGELGIDTLEELEIAAHDGSLAELDGMGVKRTKGIRDALAGMLSRSAGRRSRQRQKGAGGAERPAVALLLEIDSEYRLKAGEGKLRKIAPRRFNPGGDAWLPIMETKRRDWAFTVLYSNTARAHELGKIHDWVVIYYERDGIQRQNTVVTAEQGPFKGRRVVRGREGETLRYYGAA
jgi:DNA polymerase (family 10)